MRLTVNTLWLCVYSQNRLLLALLQQMANRANSDHVPIQ